MDSKFLCGGMFSSEIFVIHDYFKYYLTTYESQVNVNLSLPTNYIIKFILTSNSGGDPNICYLRFDSSSGAYVGKGSSTSRNITVSAISKNVGTIGTSVDTEYTFTKQNGVVTCTDGTSTVSGSTSSYNTLNHIMGSTNGKVKDIRIIKL